MSENDAKSAIETSSQVSTTAPTNPTTTAFALSAASSGLSVVLRHAQGNVETQSLPAGSGASHLQLDYNSLVDGSDNTSIISGLATTTNNNNHDEPNEEQNEGSNQDGLPPCEQRQRALESLITALDFYRLNKKSDRNWKELSTEELNEITRDLNDELQSMRTENLQLVRENSENQPVTEKQPLRDLIPPPTSESISLLGSPATKQTSETSDAPVPSNLAKQLIEEARKAEYSSNQISAMLGYSGKNGPQDVRRVLAGTAFNIPGRLVMLRRFLDQKSDQNKMV